MEIPKSVQKLAKKIEQDIREKEYIRGYEDRYYNAMRDIDKIITKNNKKLNEKK